MPLSTTPRNQILGDHKVILFISRNKDNKFIFNFHERRESFFGSFSSDEIMARFRHFIADGIPGEYCRCYISLNRRDPEKIQKQFLHRLIDSPLDFNFVEPILAAIAAKPENALEKKWFFDFDSSNPDDLEEFMRDLEPQNPSAIFKTPNGYSIVVDHGFDTRKLLEKWKDIASLKRDDLIFFTSAVK